ncbi:hypothetical protein [Clostridium sp. 1001275B_160808_H3]|uniref:hypothetical protein n=1 Tax=Clostridium sp. 1001275B_160808_H3 TaxID=2787110 RepID=UPI00189AF35D|nr:hypothetical protein [Clostridium sp. 1001275B_160808_H3]
MLEKIRNILLLLTALGAVVSIYVKVFNELAIDVIRNKYRNIPGKQSIFNTIINFIIYCFFGIYLIVTIISAVDLIRTGGWKSVLDVPKVEGGFEVIAFLVGLLIIIISIIPAVVASLNMISMKDNFRDKLENKLNSKIKKSVIIKIIISMLMSTLLTIGWIILSFNIIIRGINIVKDNGEYIFENNIVNNDMKFIVIFGFLALISITSFIVLNSLREIYKAVNEDEYYILNTSNGQIYARCYLECEDYFLIFENTMERYIKKNEIKEIRKIKILKSNDIN